MEIRTIAATIGDQPTDAMGALSPPIVTATSFEVRPGEVGFSAAEMGDETPYFYSRWANPTVRGLEKKLAALEGAEDCLCFATGMAAASGLLLHKLSAGDKLVISDVCYAGVAEFARQNLPRYGIEVVSVDTSNLREVAAAITKGTAMVYVESPCNPILRLADIQAIAGLAHAAGAVLAVDATIATPIGMHPLEFGADYVVHSLTKYACGHGNALGGAVLGSAELLGDLRQDSLVHLGAAMNPNAAATINQGLATLPIRMEAHQSGALAVASFLEGHSAVKRVLYPGLESHPQYGLAKRQLKNFSGLLSFVIEDGTQWVEKIADRIKVISYAVSLGKHRSLLYYIPTEDILRTSFDLDAERAERYRAWAGEGVFRLSVGLEDPKDLVEDLTKALA